MFFLQTQGDLAVLRLLKPLKHGKGAQGALADVSGVTVTPSSRPRTLRSLGEELAGVEGQFRQHLGGGAAQHLGPADAQELSGGAVDQGDGAALIHTDDAGIQSVEDDFQFIFDGQTVVGDLLQGVVHFCQSGGIV